MCSFAFSTKIPDKDKINDINYYLKPRGPDHTQIEEINNCFFLHNLLSITGKFAPQPYTDDDIVLIYNGEIYNYLDFGNYSSDGECIIPLYKEFGTNCVKQLDGEFAICLVDFSKNIAIISSDVFKTKPLFIARDGIEIGCSTYRTPLQKLGFTNIETAKPNTTYIISLSTGDIQTQSIYEFDLKQHKDTYEDWIDAFHVSVDKRIKNTNKNFFLGLSSGYDSGAIFNELNNSSIPFKSISLLGGENNNILTSRISKRKKDAECINFQRTPQLYAQSNRFIKKMTEDYRYTIHSSSSGYNEYNTMLVNDAGSNNMATVCKKAKDYNCKICLSGSGADEIISDYGFNGRKIYQHSNFGGLFPEDLSTIFPWVSFYGSSMESYLAKDEYVGGSFGIEMRYPYLDTRVVQEFLWLTQNLKNKEYKAPIDYYFKKYDVPYEYGQKRGF